MNVLIISDTHYKITTAAFVIEHLLNDVEAVIHLGDMFSDAAFLKSKFPNKTFHCVAGNGDYYFSINDSFVDDLVVEYNGVKIFATHGHKHRVKNGYTIIARDASEKGAKVALCGHTHEPDIKTVNDILIINPGSITYPRGRIKKPSYAVLSISDEGKLNAEIKYATEQY